MTITLTNSTASDIIGVRLTDIYPAGLTTMAGSSSLVYPNRCDSITGASVNVVDNGGKVSLTGGKIPANASCQVVVDLVGGTVGTFTNDTGSVLSTNAPSAPSAAATLAVNNPLLAPIVSKSFAPTSVPTNNSDVLTITLQNPNSSDITGVSFTDNYPSGLVNSNIIVTSNCLGTLDYTMGSSYLALSNGVIKAGQSCSESVRITGTTAGNFVNHTGAVKSANAQDGADATATIQITQRIPAPIVHKAFSTDVLLGGTSQMKITLDNPNSVDIDQVSITDMYPAGMVNAANAVVLQNTCGGIIATPASGNYLTLSGLQATIPAQGSCQVLANVVGSQVGSWTNNTGQVGGSNSQASAGASATLLVSSGTLLQAPTVTKAFAPSSVVVGGSSTLTITLANPNSTNIRGAAFMDVYPPGMANAASGVVASNSCGGTLTASANGTSAMLIGGTIPQIIGCSVVINVVGTATGSVVNHTGAVTSANASSGVDATATLTVNAALPQAPTVAKSFAPSIVAVGGATQMTVTLTNANGAAIVGASFTDTYPAGMTNAASNVIQGNTCGGTVVAAASGASAALSNGTIPANGSCSVVINAVGTSAGALTNNTGPVQSANANLGASASATLNVSSHPLVDLGITITDGVASYAPNRAVTYTIVATNPGPSDSFNGSKVTTVLSGAGVTNATWVCLGSGGATCASSGTGDIVGQPVSLPVGGKVTFTQVVTLSNTAIGSLTNTATINVSPALTDTNPANNSATDTDARPTQSQTINFTSVAPANAVANTGSYVPAATASSGLPVVLTVDQSSVLVCQFNPAISGSIKFIGAGMCIIDANQDGDATYLPAAQAQQWFAVAGAGGTSAQTIQFTSTPPSNAVIRLGNYTPLASASSGLPVVLTIDASSATVCAINNGVVTFIGGGVCTIDANQGGSATYAPAAQAQQSFAVGSAGGAVSQTITFTSTPPGNGIVGGNYVPVAVASSLLPVVLTIAPDSVLVCAISNGVVSFIGAGLCTIDANQGGDSIYAPAAEVHQSFTVGSAGGTTPQTITFMSTAPSNAKVGGSYAPLATASSGLPVVLSVASNSPNVCRISSGVVSFIGVGACWIYANQGGDATYAPAPQVQQSFVVSSASGTTAQTITFTSAAPANAKVAGATYTPTAVSQAGSPSVATYLPILLTIDATSVNVCEITNGVVSFIGAGLCTIDAYQGGNAIYAPTEAQQSFAVGNADGTTSQTITFTSVAPGNAAAGSAGSYTPVAVASSGLPVVLTVDQSSVLVCRFSSPGSVSVTFIGAGTCTIDATQGGNATYAPANPAQQSFVVARAGGTSVQVIQFTSAAPSNAVVGSGGYTPTAFATSSLPVVLTIDASAVTVCSISNGVVAFIGVGRCTIDANQGGNAAYAPAAQKQQFFNVGDAGGTTSQTITFTSPVPSGAQVQDSYVPVAVASSGLPVLLTIDAASATACAISNGVVSFIGTGTCTIDANQGGNATYAPAPQKQQSVVVGGAAGTTSQTIAFTSTAPANASVGSGISYLPTAVASSGLPVVLTIDAASATVCTISNGVVSFTGAGVCAIDANQGGNTTYAAAPQKQQSFSVAGAAGTKSQSITFTSTAPSQAVVGGATYTVTATASSGLAVTLTIDVSSATVCTIGNGMVSFIGAGSCTIDANQGGNAIYAPALQKQQTVTVGNATGTTPQTISFTSTAPSNATVGGTAYAASATATSGLPVTLTIDVSSTAVCTISNGTVSLIGAGTCTIDANQGGNATYAAAPQKQQAFAVGSATGTSPQTITFTSTAPSNATVGGAGYTATATATSGLTVSLTIDVAAAAVCTISNGVVSFIGAGVCTIDADQGGDATYSAAPQKQQSFTVGGATGTTPQTITFTSTAPSNATLAGAPYAVTATASSGLPVSLTIDVTSATVCTISNGVVSFIGTGTCTIDANQSGNATFAPAAQVQQSFLVSGGTGTTPQTITFTSTAPGSATVGGATYMATATASSGLPVTLVIDAASIAVCAISSGAVSFIGAGMCTIDANQSGNVTFAPAPQKQQSFSVGAGTGATAQTITFTSTSPGNAMVGGATYTATATASSGLPVTLTIDATSSTVCTISNGGVVSFVGAGTCVIDANQGGDATFAPAAQVQQTFAVVAATTVGPMAVGDGLVVNSGQSATTVNGSANSVLANDFNPNVGAFGRQLIATIVNAPSHGAVSMSTDGTFIYTNNGDSSTQDLFQYSACDAIATAVCANATVLVTIVPVGATLPSVLLPDAINDATSVTSAQSTSVLFDGSVSVLSNDTDPNVGGHLSATQVGGSSYPAHGAVSLNLPGQPAGSFGYTNNGDAATQDAFYYQACDSLYGACALARVTITVAAVGQPLPTILLPVAVDDEIQLAPGASATSIIGDVNVPSSVLDNDANPNGGSLLAALTGSSTQHGMLTFGADGTFQYANAAGDPATSDTFHYQACDAVYGVCAPATVSVSITNAALNRLPIANSDNIAVAPGGVARILVGGAPSVLANDSDPDVGETATLKAFVVGGGPQHGGLTLNADGTFSYNNTSSDPATSDSFTYEACDVHGACIAATVSISIGTVAGANPVVSCKLSTQVYLAGATSKDGTTDVVNIDLSKLFAAPLGNSLAFGAIGLPGSLSLDATSGLVTGTLTSNDAANSPYLVLLVATAAPAGTSASEAVEFQVLDPLTDHIYRSDFDVPPQPCQ